MPHETIRIYCRKHKRMVTAYRDFSFWWATCGCDDFKVKRDGRLQMIGEDKIRGITSLALPDCDINNSQHSCCLAVKKLKRNGG